MAVDAMRAMLDELMGEDRDGTSNKPKRHFRDPDVCKYFLCGFCPNEEFQKTRNDPGPCELVHDEKCKAQWDALSDEERSRYGYEAELLKWLERMLDDLSKRIKRNTERLEAEADPPLPPDDQARVSQMGEHIAQLLKASEQAGEQGNVDAAQAALAESEKVKAEQAAFEAAAKARVASTIGSARYGAQQVCQVSGLIINSEETRVRDHMAGRNYRSWCKLHEKVGELKDTFKKRSSSGRPYSNGMDAPAPARDHSTPKDHSSRDRDRAREKEKERDREKREHSRQHRDSDRPRSTSRRSSPSRKDRERDRSHSERDGSRHRSSSHRSTRPRDRSRSRDRAMR